MRSLSVVIIVVVVLLAAGCVSQQPPAPVLTPVKVGYQPTISNGPLYIAKDEGYFAEQGIDLQLVRVPSFASSIPSLLQGDLDASGGPVESGAVNAIAKGARLRIVADKGSVRNDTCAPNGLMVRKDLYDKGIVRNVSDLKGRRVFAMSWDYDIACAMALGNLTRSDIEFADMDYASAVTAFRNGGIDAGILTEPYVTQVNSSGAAVMLVPSREYVPGYGVPLFFGPSILDKNPELGRKFMVAYLKGVRQYNEGKTPRNLAILGNYTPLNQSVLSQACWWPISADGQVSPESIQPYLDWQAANGEIEQPVEAARLLDMSFAGYAGGILGNGTAAPGGSR